MNDTAPDEDVLRLPGHWGSALLARRGDAVKAEPLDPGASGRVARRLKFNAADLRHALAQTEHAAFAPAALRHLDGEPDPEGAAVLSALQSGGQHRGSDSAIGPELDAWIADHGLPFAVAASITRLGLHHWGYSGRDGGIRERLIRRLDLSGIHWLNWELDLGIADLRRRLAAASEADYAAAVAEAERLRGDYVDRLIVTVLFPERRDWAEEVCREHKSQGDPGTEPVLWRAIDRADLLAATGLRTFQQWDISRDLIGCVLRNLGPDALPFLTETLRLSDTSNDNRRLLYESIALVPSDAAMKYLVARITEPYLFEHAAQAAARFPRRALRVIAAQSRTVAPEVRPRLRALAAAAGDHSTLDTATRAAIDDLLAPSAAPVADPADLPRVLTAPPWTVKAPKRKAVTIALSAPEGAETAWEPGELEAWSKPAHDYFSNLTDADWQRQVDGKVKSHRSMFLSTILTYAPMPFALQALPKWQGDFRPYTYMDLKVITSRFGALAAEPITVALTKNTAYHEALVPIRSLGTARLAADWFARLKTARASAVKWFERHGAAGMSLLVPDALGPDKKLRTNAEGALVYAAMINGTDTLETAAEPYGPEAVEAILTLLDGDPLEPRGGKVPKPGTWAVPEMLPEVLTADRTQRLPDDSVRHLVTVLALATPDYPYLGLDIAAEACDRASLAAFSRAVFQAWLSVGGSAKDGWALTQLAHFPDDDTVRLLAPLVREWPGQSQHKRAVTGLAVLGAIGSEGALRAIQGIADKVKFRALKEEAGRQIELIATGLGLSREELADRLLPDFGLGEDGSMLLDYGPRSFTVGFDEQLKPFVADADGKPRKALPKPGAKDDPELADASYKRFAALKKELRNVAADQVQRLEAAMVNGRTWTKDEFERYYVHHPLNRHLARRLVWCATADGAETTFRVAEDRTYTDAADDAFALPEGATVRLGHPVRMGDIAAEWSDLFADYEILQPFEQLGRPVLALTDEEAATGRLARFEEAQVEVGRLLGLTKHGWRRAAPEDGGVEPGLCYPLPGGGFVTVALDPGICVGMVGENPVQTLQTARICADEDYWWRGSREPDADHPKDLDPVTVSEVLAALTRITAKD